VTCLPRNGGAATLLVAADRRPVDEIEERPDPREILEVFRDQERTRLQDEDSRPTLQRVASGALIDLGSGERTVHAGSDDDDVEAEPPLPLRILDFVDGVADETGEGVEGERGLLDLCWAPYGVAGVDKLRQHHATARRGAR
jgi:hypothetical protein